MSDLRTLIAAAKGRRAERRRREPMCGRAFRPWSARRRPATGASGGAGAGSRRARGQDARPRHAARRSRSRSESGGDAARRARASPTDGERRGARAGARWCISLAAIPVLRTAIGANRGAVRGGAPELGRRSAAAGSSGIRPPRERPGCVRHRRGRRRRRIGCRRPSRRRDERYALALEASLAGRGAPRARPARRAVGAAIVRGLRALPGRQLVPEELAVEAQALRGLGLDDDANAVERHLRARFPDSVARADSSIAEALAHAHVGRAAAVRLRRLRCRSPHAGGAEVVPLRRIVCRRRSSATALRPRWR